MRSELKAVDLFCGCGGLSVGLEKAGFKVIGALDIDPVAIKTYRANHKGVISWNKPIEYLSSSVMLKILRIKKGELDLLAGCPPCQGFTPLRTFNGSRSIVDPRNDLILEFQRLVAELEPRVVMMENVPELAGDRRFVTFSTALREMGYDGVWKILDAQDYGSFVDKPMVLLMIHRELG
ncbi:DNA cytosine methyltransferase [Chloroflexota bacterium]